MFEKYSNKYLTEKLNKKEANLADLLADDVSDYLGDTMDFDEFSSMDQEEKEDVVNNALGKLSDKYYNDGDFDKDLDKLMNRKYKEVTSYIASQLSEGIEIIDEARGAKSTEFSKPGNDGDIYFSKREGNAVAVRQGDLLQMIYVYDGEVKLGKVQKTDKRWENMGKPSEKLLVDLKLKNVGGLNTKATQTEDGKLIYAFLSESVNEAKDPVYKKGDKVLIQLTHKGGVGKFANSMSKSKNTEEARILKRIKNKLTGGYKYELSNFITVHPSEIVGLAESVNEEQGKLDFGGNELKDLTTKLWKGLQWKKKGNKYTYKYGTGFLTIELKNGKVVGAEFSEDRSYDFLKHMEDKGFGPNIYGSLSALAKDRKIKGYNTILMFESEEINEAIGLPTVAVLAIGAALAARIGLMKDDKLQKLIDTTKQGAKTLAKELPIIGKKIKDKEFNDKQSAEIQKYLKDELTDQDITDILMYNPDINQALVRIASGNSGHKTYYDVIRELGGAAEYGRANKKFLALRKKIASGEIKINAPTKKDFMNEGQFSWMTHDSDAQIGSEAINRVHVYMFDNEGNKWEEKRYEGYGEFGGKDYYDLLATMNGYTEEDLKDKKLLKKIRVMGKPEMRQIGIALAFDDLKPKNGKKVLFPALVTDPRYNWKRHNFEEEADSDPNQSWAVEDDYDDDDWGYDESANESWMLPRFESFVNEAKSFDFPKSFVVKDTLHYAPMIDGKPKKFLKGTYKLKKDNGNTAIYFNQAFKAEVEVDHLDITNFNRTKSHFKVNENENRVYGMFTDDQGKPGKLDKELLDIALKGLPSNIVKNIDAVEANGYGKSSAISPPTVSNKGQSRGTIEYHKIGIGLLKPMGKNKITAITLGLRKRTSGPGTGYLFMKVAPDWRHNLGPDAEGAIEFWDDPSHFLQKLYNEKFKNWF